jgi:PAS domain-containing protein
VDEAGWLRVLAKDFAGNPARARAAFRSSGEQIFVLDRSGRFLDYWTSRPEDLFGAPEAFLGRRADEVLPPEIAGKLLDRIERCLATGEVEPFVCAVPNLSESCATGRLAWSPPTRAMCYASPARSRTRWPRPPSTIVAARSWRPWEPSGNA